MAGVLFSIWKSKVFIAEENNIHRLERIHADSIKQTATERGSLKSSISIMGDSKSFSFPPLSTLIKNLSSNEKSEVLRIFGQVSFMTNQKVTVSAFSQPFI